MSPCSGRIWTTNQEPEPAESKPEGETGAKGGCKNHSCDECCKLRVHGTKEAFGGGTRGDGIDHRVREDFSGT